jgi:hypothetical protein
VLASCVGSERHIGIRPSEATRRTVLIVIVQERNERFGDGRIVLGQSREHFGRGGANARVFVLGALEKRASVAAAGEPALSNARLANWSSPGRPRPLAIVSIISRDGSGMSHTASNAAAWIGSFPGRSLRAARRRQRGYRSARGQALRSPPACGSPARSSSTLSAAVTATGVAPCSNEVVRRRPTGRRVGEL